MKIQIKTEKRYTMIVNGEESPGWVEESSWEGFTKYKRGSETVIVSKHAVENLFSLAMGGSDQPQDADVIVASPSFASKLKGDD